jgi:opacity protein-like surface antigen
MLFDMIYQKSYRCRGVFLLLQMIFRGVERDMKKLLVFVFLFGLAMTGFSQDSESSTTENSREGRPDIPGDLFIDFGFNLLSNAPTDMAINSWGSRAVNMYYQYSKMIGESHIGVSPGLGIGVSKYSFQRDVTLIEGDDGITTTPLSNILGLNQPRRSQFDAVYLDIPLDIWYYANRYDKRGFKVGIGGKGGFRIDSKTKYVYSENGENKTTKQKENWGLNQFRYGVHLKVGFGVFHLYGSYMFSPLFDNSKLDPSLQRNPNTWTVGVSIAGF